MRKFLIPLLVATALTPVAAQARQDRSDDRSEVRSERSVQRAERSNAERPARAERSVNVERQVRAERAPRVERSVDADRPKRADRIERVERNSRPDRTRPVDRDVQPTQQAQVPAPVQPVQNVPINQTRRSGLAGAFTQLGKDMIARGDHTNDGDHDHDGDHHGHDGDHHWDKDWRHNHRYDWWSYRNHYRSLYHLGSYYDPYGWGYNRWSVGLSLWPSYYGSNYWLDDPWMYRLPPAYGPYRWVRYYDDALLVNIYTGQVADVVYNFFW
jgi:hypothetical protein